MDQLVQCPVCTLFLHNGMSLESHLDTHPKDQVIRALCSLSKPNNNYGSRTSTPMHSERSYTSRSRTPAMEDAGGTKWSSGSRNGEHDRYWRRTPSRTPRSSTIPSRVATPASENRIPEMNFENASISSSGPFPYPMKMDKTQQTYTQNPVLPDFDPQYEYYPEDSEIKFSRSPEYNAIDNCTNMFAINMPSLTPGMKMPPAMLPTLPRKGHDIVKLVPKPNNLLVKNMSGVQYLPPGVKPLHVVMPQTPTFVQKNLQNNTIMTGNVPTSTMMEKNMPPPMTNQFNQINSTAFTPGTTVVTQNSQIIYREMVHSLDGKPFISSVPAVLSGNENVTNVAQTSSMYQNLMVVNPFGNGSCMYASPQQLLPKPGPSMYNTTMPAVSTTQMDKTVPNLTNDFSKTLIIEVGPIVQPPTLSTSAPPTSTSQTPPSSTSQATSSSTSQAPSSSTVAQPETPSKAKKQKKKQKCDSRTDTPTGSYKGLKILSNIKVEVPVQHHKNMLNTIMDLTGPNDSEYQTRPISPDKILPDIDDGNNKNISKTDSSHSRAGSPELHTFCAINNIDNSQSSKDSIKTNESKIENEFSDSCPVPDLICNEKPSISPCSELSEHGDHSNDQNTVSPKSEVRSSSQNSSHTSQNSHNSIPINSQNTQNNTQPLEITNLNQNNSESTFEQRARAPLKYNNPLRLNNIYVKKPKKILQIKNAKTSSAASSSSVIEPTPSSSSSTPENFSITKLHQDNKDKSSASTLHTISIERLKDSEDQHEFDADTEEQSMDIEPVPPSSLNASFSTTVDIIQVKEENNTSNEGGFSNETGSSDRQLTPLETLRPINVVTYGTMPPDDYDNDSSHRELLDLEAASKSKHFVNMMSDNYFGDNIYADYFTPDRVESFNEREQSHAQNNVHNNIWGEPSVHKENEFVLPNFIHESYKIADSNYGDDNEACERDSKADVLSESRSEGELPLNICSDEKMPPRGELSGQESNGDMESAWNGMYPDVPPAEPYDLMARESWVSDGSEVDATEKRDLLEEHLQSPKSRVHTCALCGAKVSTLKELRAHKSLAHAIPTSSGAGGGAKTTYSRLLTAKAIKKEDKTDDHLLAGNLLSLDNKQAIAAAIPNVFEAIAEIKPKLETLIKQEKRRRKDYVCSTCKVDQGSEAGLAAHRVLHPLECLTCGKCFRRRANLALHIKTHYGIRNYKCEVCPKRFVTRQKLMEHNNIHTGHAPIKCPLCDLCFRRYSNMVQHRDRHHFHKKMKVRDFICHCGAIYHSKAKLLWHKETHDERPKACQYCSEKFVHSASLTRHVRRTHNEYYVPDKNKGKAENVTCPVCKQVYLRANLRAHLLTHSGKRPHQCVICSKSFTTKWNLKLHRWTHASRSSKPFKCSLCKGAFIRQTEFIAHMNAHRSVRPYTCKYCGCQFIRKYNCQRHVREHEMAKKYICEVAECGKSFHRSYYLSEHMKVHSGARPFACSICGKTSSNKSNHNKHLKIHHAREPVAMEA